MLTRCVRLEVQASQCNPINGIPDQWRVSVMSIFYAHAPFSNSEHTKSEKLTHNGQTSTYQATTGKYDHEKV